MEQKDFDFVVVGGGMSGICAALAAARHGAKTALVQDRPVLGGNASSEIRMHICGADIHGSKPNARETGIIEELLLTNRYRNPQQSFSVQDYIFEEIVRKEKNLTLYLNTRVLDVQTQENKICSVTAVQMTTEREFCFSARYFADATGDGFLGFRAGARFMYGRESKAEFGEKDAPNVRDNKVMGNSLMFTAKDMGVPIPFQKPVWAYTYSEEDLKNRDHAEITSGYWWIEASGDNIISNGDAIRDELVKMLFGVWDHVKNVSGHNAENYALDWIGALPGKRESRRLLGDYVLTENDLVAKTEFSDTVAYGGWNMDMHEQGGMFSLGCDPTTYFSTEYIYPIPYRCLYSVNIENLFLAGRAISVSHMAFGSTRVMATCAVVGQAAGTAAALCVQKKITPRELNDAIEELQTALMTDDCYLPGRKLLTRGDLAQKAKIAVSSGEDTAMNLVNGELRSDCKSINCWKSNGISPTGEWVKLSFERVQKIKKLIVRFDSDLSNELTITISDQIRAKQKPFSATLVKDYDILFFRQGALVEKKEFRNNYLRLNICEADVEADEIQICFLKTYGSENVSVYAVNVFGGESI